MFPKEAFPVAILWLIAVAFAIFRPGPIAGVPFHTYTGILFVAAVLASVWVLVRGTRAK